MKLNRVLVLLLALIVISPSYSASSATTTTSSTSTNPIYWGLSEMQGGRPTQEDRYFAKEIKRFDEENNIALSSWWFFGVLDGHGGEVTAQIASELLPQNVEAYSLIDSPEEALKSAIKATEDTLRTKNVPDGSTLICALIDENGTAWVANLGDSRAIQTRNGNVEDATNDFKPTNGNEQTRIEQAGGTVMGERIAGDLAVSRSLGDFRFKRPATIKQRISDYIFRTLNPENQEKVLPILMTLKPEAWQDPQAAITALFANTDEETKKFALEFINKVGDWVSAEPEIKKMQLKPGDTLILACDGLWDEVKSPDAAITLSNVIIKDYSKLVAQKPYPKYKEVGQNWLVGPARVLRDLSHQNGSGDNITVMIVSYGVQQPNGAFEIGEQAEQTTQLRRPEDYLKVIGQPVPSNQIGTNMFTAGSLQQNQLIGLESSAGKTYAIYDPQNNRVVTKLSPQNQILEYKNLKDITLHGQPIYTLKNSVVLPRLTDSPDIALASGRKAKDLLPYIGTVASQEDLETSKLKSNLLLKPGEIVLIKRSNGSWTYAIADTNKNIVVQEIQNKQVTSSKPLGASANNNMIKALVDRPVLDALPYTTQNTTATLPQPPAATTTTQAIDSIIEKPKSEWATYINKEASAYDLANAAEVTSANELNDKELILVLRSSGKWTYGIFDRAANRIAITLIQGNRPIGKELENATPEGWVKTIKGRPTFDSLPY